MAKNLRPPPPRPQAPKCAICGLRGMHDAAKHKSRLPSQRRQGNGTLPMTSAQALQQQKVTQTGKYAPTGIKCGKCGMTSHTTSNHSYKGKGDSRSRCPKCGSLQHRIHPVKRNGAQQFISGTVSQQTNGKKADAENFMR